MVYIDLSERPRETSGQPRLFTDYYTYKYKKFKLRLFNKQGQLVGRLVLKRNGYVWECREQGI